MLWDIIGLLVVLLVAGAGIGGIGWLGATRRLKEDQQHHDEPNLEKGTNHDQQIA